MDTQLAAGNRFGGRDPGASLEYRNEYMVQITRKHHQREVYTVIKKISRTILGIVIVYGAVAFAIKAGLGVLPVDAAIATIADVIGMKVGTFSMLFHGCFFIGQILIEKRNFRKAELLQILYITLGGTVLNFILYVVLANVTIPFYPLRLLVSV